MAGGPSCAPRAGGRAQDGPRAPALTSLFPFSHLQLLQSLPPSSSPQGPEPALTWARGHPEHESPQKSPLKWHQRPHQLPALSRKAKREVRAARIHPALLAGKGAPRSTSVPKQGHPWWLLRAHRAGKPGSALLPSRAVKKKACSVCIKKNQILTTAFPWVTSMVLSGADIRNIGI